MNVKLIDFGLSMSFGSKKKMYAAYLCPELFSGDMRIDARADCWGVGVWLYQLYNEGDWKLVDRQGRLMAGKPLRGNCDEIVQQLYINLLKVVRSRRLTLADVRSSDLFKKFKGQKNESQAWAEAVDNRQQNNRHVQLYQNTQLAPSAHATKIDTATWNEESLRGLLEERNIRVVLVQRVDRTYDTQVCSDTQFNTGDWVYFGFPSNSETEDAMTELCQALGASRNTFGLTAHVNRRNALAAGSLVTCTLEFDCIVFPEHVGNEATIGVAKKSFNLNILGIHRYDQDDIEWYPAPDAIVRAGDIGLLIRQPCRDGTGTTESTVTDEVLDLFMDPVRYADVLKLGTAAGVNKGDIMCEDGA